MPWFIFHLDYASIFLKKKPLLLTALLSERERHFVRDILKPNLGLERVAIVINQMDLVPEDEVYQFLRW